MNEVNARLGRVRPPPRKRAQKKIMRQTANRLVAECGGWKAALGRAWLDINPDDEFERAYTDGEHSNAAE
jgi:hypothetical protein